MDTQTIVNITCGFLIAVCSIGCILYFLIAKDFIEDYMEDKKNDEFSKIRMDESNDSINP